MFKEVWNEIYGFLEILWSWPLFILVIGTGLYFSFKTHFFQITGIKIWWKKTIGEILTKKVNITGSEGELTSKQTIATVLGGTVGSGNIAGVATAIYSGGPGAVFWMWIIAIVGMLTKMVEVTLAVKFRKKGENGAYYGGPMYYMKAGLGKVGVVLAAIYGIALFIDVSTNACVVQVSTLIDSINSVFKVPTIVSAVVISIITLIIVLSGGTKRIGKVSAFIVPPMIAIYFIGCIGVIVTHISNLPIALRDIFACAFGAKPLMGGATGYAISAAISKGTARGIFSNEAGAGSATTVHATSKTDHPIHQGMYGIFEVFIDTIIVCSLTAFAILCGEVLPSATDEIAGVGMVIQAFKTTWGNFGEIILCVVVALFCYSGYLGFFVAFRACTEWLFGAKLSKYANVFFFILPIIAALFTTLEIWSLSDIAIGLVIIPNLIALILLSPKFIELFKEYIEKIKIG